MLDSQDEKLSEDVIRDVAASAFGGALPYWEFQFPDSWPFSLSAGSDTVRFPPAWPRILLFIHSFIHSFIHLHQTASSIQNFFLAMVLNPEIQKKAQKQLDAVIGKDRIPNFDDLPSLPYLEAVMMEVLRFHPVVPLSKLFPSSIHKETIEWRH